MTSGLEAAADAFSLRLADALEDFEKGLTGKYESLSRLNEVFE
jgi:hypothetical protein